MASLVTNEFKYQLLLAWLNANDIRAKLIMNNTTCDTETDAIVNIADYTTLDEADATGYAELTLSSEAVTKDDVSDRGEYDAADLVFSGLSGDATRDYQGVLLYQYVDGTALNDIVGVFIDFVTDIPATATQVTVPWDAEGIIQAT